ncbi:MAG: MFS transporter [Alphaproteobacteria bacterium]
MRFNLSDIKENNKSLWSISLVCFLWSTASVMVFNLLPAFLRDVLGASYKKVGSIEGTVFLLAFLSKVFSGVLSDFFKKRKTLILIGALFSIFTKFLFFISFSIFHVFAAKSLDRLSKGIRAAPTDALIGDLSSKQRQGTNYGVRHSLSMLGAMTGGVIAYILMNISSNNYRLVFAFSIIPSFLAFVVLWCFVKEPQNKEINKKKLEWNFKDIKHLPKKFWYLLGITFLLMMARFSEGFLNLRAKELGWSVAFIPLLMIGYDFFSATMAIPIGRLADRFSRHLLLSFGLFALILTNVVVISFSHPLSIVIAILLAGAHMGMTQGLIAALIAENTTFNLRGTAFALYYLSSGIAVFIGNHIAGTLSDLINSPVGAFIGGLFFTTSSFILLLYFIRKKS